MDEVRFLCMCFLPVILIIFFFCSSLRQDVDEPDSCVCFFSTEVRAATLSFFELGSKFFFIIFQSFLAGSRWSEILVYVFFTRDFDQFFFVVQFFFFSFPAGCGWTEIFPCAFYPQSSVERFCFFKPTFFFLKSDHELWPYKTEPLA